jgi:hypothetical protein
MKKIFKTIIITIIFIGFMVVLFTPTKKDREAFEICTKTYDSKTCQKLIYGNY